VCDVNRRELTKTPAENASNATIMESYEEEDEVIPGLRKQVYQTNDST
jgi:hypothetical protein